MALLVADELTGRKIKLALLCIPVAPAQSFTAAIPAANSAVKEA
jgi:hypothetical protein